MYDGFISYSHAADDLLAPRLQAGLQRFAKPWWKRRAVRIFRDESSLAANPHLWSSITEALEDSGWFVLLLSPDAAQSEWVGKEIEHWKATKPVDRILPVVTDGEFGWSDGEVAGSSVPAALHGVFSEEPRWVDLRFARSEEHLDLQNPTFSAAIADIASAIRGVPKDELESEEVRQHRRTVRTAWAAGIALLALSVVAVGASIQSGRNAAEADAQRIAAVRAGSLAEVRELAAAAIAMLEVDPELAVLLGLEAIRSAPDTDDPPLETKIALRQAIQSSRLIARHEIEVDGEIFFADLSPAADAVVTAEETSVRLVDLQTGNTVWTRSLSDLEGRDGSPGSICPGEVFFSLTGTEIFVGLIDGSGTGCNADVPEAHTPGSGVVVLEASTGEVLRSRWLGSCPDQVIGSPSPDGLLLPVVTPADGNCDPGTPLDWTITLLDTAGLEPIREIPIPDFGMTSWSADGSRISIGSFFGLGAVVYDTVTGDEVSVMDDEFFLGFLSPDGSMLAGTDIETAVIVYDVETGRAIDRLPDLGDGPRHITWTDDGTGLMAGGQGSRSAVWHVETGEVDILLPNTGSAVTIHSDDEAGRLVHVGAGNVTVWDVSGGL
ncbi:MAG: TIR domain-containing protein, partial [Acidimicrobiia bacterium]|nr:TIR domain-containing protein [Acidimicrobiia bacterium]